MVKTFPLFAFTACNDNDDDVPEPDKIHFSMEVSGDMEIDLDGEVFYDAYHDPEYDEEIFLLNKIPETEDSATLMFIKGGDPSGTGPFPIVYHDEHEAGEFPEDAFSSRFSLIIEEGEVPAMYFFEGVNGTINFEESTDAFVSGSFEYRATGGNMHSVAFNCHCIKKRQQSGK